MKLKKPGNNFSKTSGNSAYICCFIKKITYMLSISLKYDINIFSLKYLNLTVYCNTIISYNIIIKKTNLNKLINWKDQSNIILL